MAWLALPLVLFLPGFLTWAAFLRPKGLDFWEALFLTPFISILLSSWLGLVLAEVGLFALPLLSILLASYCLALVLILRGRLLAGSFPRPSLGLDTWLLLGLLAFSAWAFFRPAQVIAGTFDPGIYLSTGASIARTGAIAYSDPLAAGLGSDLRSFLLERRWETGIGAVRLPAFWMPEYQGSTVIPAFFHLYPVWLAILYSMGGAQAALYVSPVFGLLGVWALYLIGKRLGGTGVGLLASAFLAANVAQVWFARYPISEAMVQALLLGGLALFALVAEVRSRLLAFLSGAALGLVHLVKIDQVFLPPAIFLLFFLLWVTGRWERRYWYFLLAYGLLLAHSMLHVFLLAFGYTWLSLGPFLPLLTAPAAILIYGVVALSLLAAALGRARLPSLTSWAADHRVPLSMALAGVVGVAALWSYFVWPLNPDPTPSAFLSSDGATPVYLRMYREEGLVRLGWYLTPLGLVLGLVGFVQLVGTRAGLGSGLLLLLFVAQLALYLWTGGLAYPAHFWAMRRYIPLVIPAFMLLSAFALWGLRSSPSFGRASLRRWPRGLLPLGLALALLVAYFQASLNVLPSSEYEGALASLSRWAAKLEDPAVVLFKPRTEGNILAAPLQHLLGKTAFVLQREPEEPFFERVVRPWLAEGRNVYLVLTDRYPRFLSGHFTYRLISDQGIGFQAMEQALDRMPRQVVPMSFPLRLYRIEPSSGGASYSYRLDGGALWTEDVLRLKLPRPPGREVRISFSAAGWRPEGAERALVSLFLDGQLRYNAALEPEYRAYDLLVPLERGVVGDLEITFATNPWGTSDADVRNRGIMLEWVQIEGVG